MQEDEKVIIDKEKKKEHPGTKNLIPVTQRSKEEARELAAKGGRKSGETRRKNKTLKEAVNWYLDQTIDPSSKSEKALLEKFPGLTYRDYVAIAGIQAATKKSDVRAMVFTRDTAGEAPAQQIDIGQDKPFEITIKTIE